MDRPDPRPEASIAGRRRDASATSRSEALQAEIAERERVEREREQLLIELAAKNEELEVQNAELERFTYTVSHDLKSPLVTIQGFLGFLQQDAAAGDLERLNADVQRIHNATARMARLLDDVLELSRIGRMVNPPQEVPLTEVAREAAANLAAPIADRGVDLEIADDLPSVYGDRVRILEVLQNLIENAVKFMGEQPRPRIAVGMRRDGAESVFYVRDNGRGVDPAYQAKIFGLFERLDQEVEGTGVGLALVKRIIEVHGGRIWVESEGCEEGSTFCFTLSQQDAAEARDRQSKSASFQEY